MAEYNYINFINLKERAKDDLRQASNEYPLIHDIIAAHSRRYFASTELADFYSHAHDLGVDIKDWEREPFADPHREKSSDGSLEWVAANLEQLSKDYPDRFILVENQQVIANSADIADLLQQALKLEISSPLIIDTHAASTVSRMAY